MNPLWRPLFCENFEFAREVQADATYKLIWQGFPVFVVGCRDANKNLHHISIAICSHETEEDFAFDFRTLEGNLEPQFSLSDRADSIFNAARSVWPGMNRQKKLF
jgi:hypothetical protein